MRAVLDRPFVIALEMRAKLLGPVTLELLEPVEQPLGYASSFRRCLSSWSDACAALSRASTSR